jgi:hypothetical protein
MNSLQQHSHSSDSLSQVWPGIRVHSFSEQRGSYDPTWTLRIGEGWED